MGREECESRTSPNFGAAHCPTSYLFAGCRVSSSAEELKWGRALRTLAAPWPQTTDPLKDQRRTADGGSGFLSRTQLHRTPSVFTFQPAGRLSSSSPKRRQLSWVRIGGGGGGGRGAGEEEDVADVQWCIKQGMAMFTSPDGSATLLLLLLGEVVRRLQQK